MKTVKRENYKLGNYVSCYGIESVGNTELEDILFKIKENNFPSNLVATVPSDCLKKMQQDSSVSIENISFYKNLSLDKINKIIELNYIEELIFILIKDSENFYKNYENILISEKNKSSIDPYANIKKLCLIEGVIVVFYCPDDLDIDLFIRDGGDDEKTLRKILPPINIS